MMTTTHVIARNTQVSFSSIQEIAAHRFAGNAFSDGPAFDAIDNFVCNPSVALADKAEALRVMTDKGMGCGRDEHLDDEVIVLSYLDEMEG